MNAVGYMRLSTKDQSKSLEYQESSIRDYCTRNNLTILSFYKDNGESSYTFDRPDYKALESFLKKFNGKCQYLIILDHDRFSRNLPEALMKISELEHKYGVKVLATSERVDIDTSDPDVFMRRAFDYLLANKELFNIRKRTKQGMHNAREKGRFLGRAPYGYINVKDGANSITIVPQQATIIQKIFKDYILGIPPYIIHINAKEMGFKNTGNSAIHHILQNCLYAGLIKVPAYKEQPERYVKGQHEPIVSELEFWHVQKLLSNKRPAKTQAAEDFPLRGVLKCWCGTNMTAGYSKGKKEYYLYYRCIKHTNVNIPGYKIHDQFDQLLQALNLEPKQIKLIEDITTALIKKPIDAYNAKVSENLKALAKVKGNILSLEEKYVRNEVSAESYKNLYSTFLKDKASLEMALKDKADKKDTRLVDKYLPLMEDLDLLYKKSDIYQKHSIIEGVFKGNLCYAGGQFRTPFVDPTFEDNILKINEKGLLFYEQPFRKMEVNPISTPNRIRTYDLRFRKPVLYPAELWRHPL